MVRLVSCRHALRAHMLHDMYPLAAALVYYLLLFFYHWVIDSFYTSSYATLKSVRLLSQTRAKDLDFVNRSIKLALQYVSGCLTKFETARASAPVSAKVSSALAGDTMRLTLRSVQHIVSCIRIGISANC